MTGFKLGTGSRNRLQNVTRELARVVERAIEITEVDFSVVYGKRSAAEQAKLVEQGFSNTANSRHLTGHAVDLVPWLGAGVDPYPRQKTPPGERAQKLRCFELIAKAMFEAADELGVPLQWGNDWNLDGIPTSRDPEERGNIADMPHFQIPWPYRVQAALDRADWRKQARLRGEEVIS